MHMIHVLSRPWIGPSLALSIALGAAGCVPPFGIAIGGECELNSDCDPPLVCRIGFCRRECTTSRDCAAGLDCVKADDDLGACQLPMETRCSLDSQCQSPLVCTMGECTNVCGACTVPGPCRDCPAGAQCIADSDGMLGCFDPSSRTCVYSSECGTEGEFVCAIDGRCRLECLTDCDCRNGEVCRERAFMEGTETVRGNLCVTPSAETGSSTCLPDSGLELEDAALGGGDAGEREDAGPPHDAATFEDSGAVEDAAAAEDGAIDAR